MISYNPKDWFFFIFRLHQSETFKQLIPLMIGVCIYSFLISFLEFHILYSTDNKEMTKNISGVYAILGFTLSMLLVFRTNSAYDRWWEGRKLWGELTNVSRSVSATLHSLLPESEKEARESLAVHLALFSYALQAHLKGAKVEEEYLLQELSGETHTNERERIINAYHQPQEVFKIIMEKVQELYKKGVLDSHQIFLFKSELNKFIDVCGGCERIKKTPIPFSYAVFLKKFIFFYVMLFPLVYGMQMEYFIIPVTVFILYVLASIELIAEEIEDPFNGDANDLPTLEMALNMKRSVYHNLKGNN